MKLIHHQFVLLLLMLLTAAMPAAAQESAGSLMNRIANKINQSPSITARYTATADGGAQSGFLTVSGKRFKLTSPQVASWFDGKTQWTYSSATGEINITEPTAEELQQINPFAVVSSFRLQFTPEIIDRDNSTVTLRLKARDAKSDIRSVDLTVNSNTLMPSKVTLSLANNQSVTIAVNDVKVGGELPDSTFKFDGKQFPGVQIVDLR